MMPGVVASSLARDSGAALPSLASADFVAGVYSVGEAAVTAADVIDKPELITASGLEVPHNAENGTVAIIGDFLGELIPANWTLVLEYEDGGTSGTTLPIVITSEDPTATSFEYIQIQRSNSGSGRKMEAYDQDGGFRFVQDADSHGAGVHKIALTRTDERLAMSVDGDAVVADEDGNFSQVLSLAAFGGTPGDWSFDACTIRSLKVYAVADDAILPSLSALL